MTAPLLVAPAVAVIAAELRKRPAWAHGEPFPVPSDLYQAASLEMAAILKKRGFQRLFEDQLKNGNFMIFGTPIITNG
jgi:hypothetical protein